MELLTVLKVLKLCKRYWYLVVIATLLAIIVVMRIQLSAKTAELQATIATAATLKAKITEQNAAISALQAAGIAQISRIEAAVKHAATLKPRTTTIVKEVYSDKTTDVHRLILNSRND